MRPRTYPTLELVERASHRQLGEWLRFLDSPGISITEREHYSQAEAEERTENEAALQRAIMARFTSLGGWSPELSKQIGWDR